MDANSLPKKPPMDILQEIQAIRAAQTEFREATDQLLKEIKTCQENIMTTLAIVDHMRSNTKPDNNTLVSLFL